MVDPTIPLRCRSLIMTPKPAEQQFSRERIAKLFLEFRDQFGRWPIGADLVAMRKKSRDRWPRPYVVNERGGIAHLVKFAKSI
jgi:hypothetical protein